MNIRIFSSNMHGVLDYAAAIALIIAPMILHLEMHSLLVYWFSIVAGCGLAFYSALTNYLLGVVKVLPFKAHIILDSIASLAFILLAFYHEGTVVSMVYCLVMGGGVIVAIALTKSSQ